MLSSTFPTRSIVASANNHAALVVLKKRANLGGGAGVVSSTGDTKDAAVTVIAAASIIAVSVSSFSSLTKNDSKEDRLAKLEVYLMDRIAKKPYLNSPSLRLHKLSSSSASSLHSRRHYISEDAVPGALELNMDSTRPKGVPTRLRILTIDVPQFKDEAFKDGICQLPSQIFHTNGPIFKDGVARPKRIDEQLDNKSFNLSKTRKELREARRPIEQKSLAQMLYYCYGLSDQGRNLKKLSLQPSSTQSPYHGQSNTKSIRKSQQHDVDPVIGVEVLEASIMNLNPNNIRRTYTSKTDYKYDPGKYEMTNVNRDGNDDDAPDVNQPGNQVTDTGIADVEEATEVQDKNDREDADIELEDSSDIRDDRTAPWNQYAWLEELHSRIYGLVPFSSPMQRSSILSHTVFGRAYHQSVPSSMSYIRWLFPWWSLVWGSSIRSVEGIDGEGECALYDNVSSSPRGFSFKTGPSSKQKKLNRASNKPHAVIADGTAMQRVPGSLRFLTRICREAKVPLYILNDPRSWASSNVNHYSTLDDALLDLRRTVTDNIVRNALEMREGNAFERGRAVGRWEKEVEWLARDAGRKTRQAWIDAKQRWKREKMEDWSELDEDSLRSKLIERKVLNDENESICSQGLTNLCKSCKEQKLNDLPSSSKE
ncbi:hypothetical protein ACHAWX_003925 [Stephanocyclus meneghinianus]